MVIFLPRIAVNILTDDIVMADGVRGYLKVAAAFGLGVAVAFFVLENAEHTSVSKRNVTSVSVEENERLKAELLVLQAELNFLKEFSTPTIDEALPERVGEVDATKALMQELVEHRNSVAQLSEELALLKGEKNRMLSERVAFWMHDPHADKEKTYKSLKSSFEAEDSVDPSAAARAIELVTLFSEKEMLSGFSVNDAECKEGRCRLLVQAGDELEVASLSQSLTETFGQDSALSNRVYIMVPDLGSGITSVYIGDEGAELSSL